MKPLRSFWNIDRIETINNNNIGDGIDNLGFNDLFFFIAITRLLISLLKFLKRIITMNKIKVNEYFQLLFFRRVYQYEIKEVNLSIK